MLFHFFGKGSAIASLSIGWSFAFWLRMSMRKNELSYHGLISKSFYIKMGNFTRKAQSPPHPPPSPNPQTKSSSEPIAITTSNMSTTIHLYSTQSPMACPCAWRRMVSHRPSTPAKLCRL